MKSKTPWIVTLLFGLMILSGLRSPKPSGYMNDVDFGRIPVLREGVFSLGYRRHECPHPN